MEKDKRKHRSSSSSASSRKKTNCLGVFGLSANTTEDNIYEIFSKFGKIIRINVIFDTQTGRSRGYCFIYFKHLIDAVDAKESCSGMEINNRRIRVDYSVTSRPHDPTPGIYKGCQTQTDFRDRDHVGSLRRRSRSRRSRSRS